MTHKNLLNNNCNIKMGTNNKVDKMSELFVIKLIIFL